MKTKPIILLCALFLMLLSIDSKGQAYLVPQAGLNLSEFTFNQDDITVKSEVGYQAGLVGRLGKNAFLYTGILYSNMENTVTWTDSLDITEDKLRVEGLFVPIQLGFSIYNADIIRIRLMAGINMSIPLNVDDNKFLLTKDDFTGNNVGAAVGFGVDIFRFVLDANFSFGINDMISVDNTKAQLNLYTLSIGYLIGGS